MNARFAILGATGAVGLEFLQLLAERRVAPSNLRLLASARSAGRKMPYTGGELPVEQVGPDSFRDIDIALFSAGGSTSREWAPVAVAAGARVVDNSSAFRMDEGVPLVIPEVNPEAIGDAKVIANPNCSTIIMNMVVWPLHQRNPVERVIVSTYQAVSGAGQQAMLELESQTRDVLDGRPARPSVLPVQTAFNLFSHNTAIDETGYNVEEVKMIKETRKIFGAPDLAITATCIRVPVLRAHSESINVSFGRPMDATEAREILSQAPGVKVVDDRENNRFPMPIEATGMDDCLVGRIRNDASRSDGRGIELFVCGDQLRKGAALNAVQIAELLVK
ncbi:MAG TPA: aspartate-semialdehyde dehydrogenase [Phycisphaerae bacterium]|nr:aspartate-semialdehyde dehydrogenase [Phycisphaerae bacterium]HRW54930.1 aspartate-semialdehyde dehydrogenase [Phycisphaerae bacterium]